MKALGFAAALAFAATACGPAPAEAADLRIAVISPLPGGCAPLTEQEPAGQRAYHELLANRLESNLLACPVVDAVAAGRALAAGEVDLAVLNPAAYGPVASSVRAILTVRPKGGLSRIPVLVGVKDAAPARRLADLKGRTVVFGGPIPAALATPRKALADQGAGPAFFAREDVAADAPAAIAAVRGGRSDAVVLNAGAWQRQCRGDAPGEDRCADLRQIWRGRPIPAAALAVRKDMPEPLRFRIIGVHVAMHLEAPAAFAAASAFAPGGEEFEAAEADALAPGTAAR